MQQDQQMTFSNPSSLQHTALMQEHRNAHSNRRIYSSNIPNTSSLSARHSQQQHHRPSNEEEEEEEALIFPLRQTSSSNHDDDDDGDQEHSRSQSVIFPAQPSSLSLPNQNSLVTMDSLDEEQRLEAYAMIQSTDEEFMSDLKQLAMNHTIRLSRHLIEPMLQRFFQYWCPPGTLTQQAHAASTEDYIQWCHQRFDLPVEGYPNPLITSELLGLLEIKRNNLINLAVHLQRQLMEYNLAHESSIHLRTLIQCMNLIHHTCDFLSNYYRSKIIALGRMSTNSDPSYDLWRCSAMALINKVAEKQQLIIYLCDQAQMNGYKRYRTSCYREIVSKRCVIQKKRSEWLAMNPEDFGNRLVRQRLLELRQEENTSRQHTVQHTSHGHEDDQPMDEQQSPTPPQEDEDNSDQERPSKRRRRMDSASSLGSATTHATPVTNDSDPSLQQDDPMIEIEFEPGGHNTRAYEEVMSIEEFVNSGAQRHHNFRQWCNLVKDNNRKAAIEHLTHAKEAQFEDITKYRSRTVFAFAQGLYFADTCQFIHYTDQDQIPENVMACKYFDQLFPCKPQPVQEWRSLPTPLFESIFRYQNLPDEVIDICYVMIGRLIHPVGQWDDYQVSLLFKGIAGSGKSTIADVIEEFYEPCDVGTISSSCEKVFGVQTIYDKYIGLCTEMKRKFNFPQDILQQAISGEYVNVPIKNQPAKKVRWTTGMMFWGNEMANLSDTQGSIRRRFLVVLFDRIVNEADKIGNLKRDIIEKELPTLIRKCNEAYMDFVTRHPKEDIWKIVPSYFVETANKIQTHVSPVSAFLDRSGMVRFKSNGLIHWDDFRQLFINFLIQENYPRIQLTEDTYKIVFIQHNLVIQTLSGIPYRGKIRSGKFIVGLERVPMEGDEDYEEGNAATMNE